MRLAAGAHRMASEGLVTCSVTRLISAYPEFVAAKSRLSYSLLPPAAGTRSLSGLNTLGSGLAEPVVQPGLAASEVVRSRPSEMV